MNADLFFDALNEIDDRYVVEAALYHAPAKRILRPILQGLAAACLVIIIGFSTVLAVSVETRDMVFGWIKEQVETVTKYHYKEGASDSASEQESAEGVIPEPRDYHLSYVPKGYSLFIHEQTQSASMRFYVDAKENTLRFSYTRKKNGSSAYFIHDNHTRSSTTIHGLPADYFQGNGPKEDNALIWTEDDTVFFVSGFLSQAELERIANSIEESTDTNTDPPAS